MKPTTEQTMQWAREAGLSSSNGYWQGIYANVASLVDIAYAAGAADMKERAVNICESESSLEISNASAAYQQGREMGATVCGVYIRALGDDE